MVPWTVTTTVTFSGSFAIDFVIAFSSSCTYLASETPTRSRPTTGRHSTDTALDHFTVTRHHTILARHLDFVCLGTACNIFPVPVWRSVTLVVRVSRLLWLQTIVPTTALEYWEPAFLVPRLSSTLCSLGSRTGLHLLRGFCLSLKCHRYALELTQSSQSLCRDCGSYRVRHRLLRFFAELALANHLTNVGLFVCKLAVQCTRLLQVAITLLVLLWVLKAPAYGATILHTVKVT